MKKKRTITGSVRPRPNKDNVKYYDVILELGKDPLTGKRNRVRFKSDSDSMEEAEKYFFGKRNINGFLSHFNGLIIISQFF